MWNTSQPLKKKEILSFATAWKNLEGIILSKINPVKKGKYTWSDLYVESNKVEVIEENNGCQKLGRERADGGLLLKLSVD